MGLRRGSWLIVAWATPVPTNYKSASNQDPIQGVNGLNNVFWNHPGRKAGRGKQKLKLETLEGIPIFQAEVVAFKLKW